MTKTLLLKYLHKNSHIRKSIYITIKGPFTASSTFSSPSPYKALNTHRMLSYLI